MFGKLAKGSGEPQPCCSLRPCLADGKPATFHRWVEWEDALLKIDYFVKPEGREKIIRDYHEAGVADASTHLEKVRQFGALVEYSDGSVGRVKPELITFRARKED